MDKRPIELEEGWARMQDGIKKLIRLLEGENEEQFNAELYMNLYTTIYNMCTQKPPYDYSEQLYQRYRETFNNYLNEKVLPALRDLRDVALLRELFKRWDNHKIMVRWLSKFFNYLDRYYVQRHSLNHLKDVGLLCFREQVYGEVKRRARDGLLGLIERERDGELVDRLLIKNILGIFIEVGMSGMEFYERDFEEALLSESANYYKRKAADWVAEDSCPDYMLKAEECLRLEEERVEHYLHASSRPKLLKEVEQEVLAKYETDLLSKEHSGAKALLRDDKRDDLARMYRLFARVAKGLDPIADMFKEHVEAEGMKLVREVGEALEAKKEKEKEKEAGAKDGPADKKPAKSEGAGASAEQQYVRSVIQLHDKYLDYVTGCFNNSSLFHKALKEAFEAFCNKAVAGSTSAELMANFCDKLLTKSSGEKLSDEAIEEALDKVVKLLAYVSDKDLFAEFYRKRLSKRLLQDRSASDDLERSVLSRLKQQCGAQFTSKMEGMVRDLQMARERQASFTEWCQTNERQLPLGLEVTVLTTGNWPTNKTLDLHLPAELVSCVELFKEYYDLDNKNRKLSWIYTQGTATVKGNFSKNPIELMISTLQACILLLFNDAPELSYQDIQERLNLPDDDLTRLLHSLACGKYKILNKEPAGRSVARTDRFAFNDKFTDKMRRIRVPLAPVDDKKKVVEDVDKDRRFAIDAAIVRTMKSRKVLQHQQLVMEVVTQLQRMFKPDLKLIKKRIEDLITREFLERDKDNSQLFRYLA